MTIAIVITRTDFSESPERAIRGILANKDRIQELHLVDPTYQEGDELYPGWSQDAAKLAPISLHYDAVPVFGPQVTQVVEIAPSCELKSGAFDLIKQTSKTATLEQTHLIFSTGTLLSGISPLYGFAVIIGVLEWIWNRLFARNKLAQRTDVRVRFLMRKGKRAFLPEWPAWRYFDKTTAPKVYAANVALVRHDDLLWQVNTHLHLGMGWWVIPFVCVWLFFTFSWISVMTGVIFYRSMFLNTWVASAWILQSLASHLICSQYIHMKWAPVYHTLFPLYLAAFPFFLTYARLYLPKQSWQVRTREAGANLPHNQK